MRSVCRQQAKSKRLPSRRTNWKLKEIEKAKDGTYELYYDTPDGSQKVCPDILAVTHPSPKNRHTSHTSLPSEPHVQIAVQGLSAWVSMVAAGHHLSPSSPSLNSLRSCMHAEQQHPPSLGCI